MGRVDGKIAIVTGGGLGIGRATAVLLAEEGAQVAATDINDEARRETVDQIERSGGQAAFFSHDVLSEADWKRVVADVQDTFGTPDVLVNNAGIYRIEPLSEITVEDWRNLMDVNVTGTFLGLKYCTPLMENEGRGSVINLSSVAGLVGVANHTCYGRARAP